MNPEKINFSNIYITINLIGQGMESKLKQSKEWPGLHNVQGKWAENLITIFQNYEIYFFPFNQYFSMSLIKLDSIKH